MPMLFIRKSCFLALALICMSFTAKGADTPVVVPGGVDMVVSINVRKLLDSGLFKKYGSDVVAKGLMSPQAKGILDATGIDPLKDVDSIVIASPVEMSSKKGVIILKGKFDESKIKTFGEAAAKDGAFKFKTTKEGSVTFHEIVPAQMPDTIYATFTDKSTILVGGEKDYLLTVASGKAEKPAGKLSTLLGKLNGKESASIVAVVTDDLKKLLGNVPGFDTIGPKLESGIVTLNVADGVDLKATVSTSDAKTVDAIKLLISGTLTTVKAQAGPNPNLLAALNKVKMVSTDKTSVTVSLALTGVEIQKLAGGK